jgi:hypothetical protein
MLQNVTTTSIAEGTSNRREHDRIRGPFDAFRIGALETPLRIFDLSLGGCFVNAMHEQKPGIRFVVKIDLPYVGMVTMKAVTLYARAGGFAVQFVDVDDETLGRLEDALDRLQERAPYDQ